MFANRSSKSKKNKRRRVEEDEKTTQNGSYHEDVASEEVVVPVTTTDRRKVNTFSSGTSIKRDVLKARQFESEREIVPQKYAGDATYESQIDTATDRDARAVMERNIKMNQDGTADSESGKVYHGQAGYKNYISKKESQIGMNKYTGTQGPIRAQTWARSICRFDYQPDLCKDYKETGFCGYGDSCKFLHDRGDYKSGWQMEKEFAEKERKRQQALAEGKFAASADSDSDDDKYVIHSDEEDDEEQFACTICREPFRNAVVTNCGHFFCEACALKHFKKTSRCFNCRKQTNGVFNVAEKLRRREKEERKLQKEKAQEQYKEDDEEQDKVHQEKDEEEGIKISTAPSGSWSVVS